MNEQVKRMAGLAGSTGASKPPKYVLPLIRFDGNRGEYRMISFNDAGEKVETELTRPLKITILRKRKLLSSFSPSGSYFTNEYESVNHKVSLFKNVAGTVTFEESGYPQDLRQKVQVLRSHEVLYVLYDGKICKFEVKGGSLGNWWDYLKVLQEADQHTFQTETVLGSEKAKNETGFSYFRVTFEKDNDTDLDVIEPLMVEIDNNLRPLDDYFRAKLLEKSGQDSASDTAARFDALTAEPTVQLDEDIDPDNIPF
jgi:hypothetical protein